MKSSKIYYSADLENIASDIVPHGFFALKLTGGNAHKWHKLIKSCISSFNSQVQWKDMWDLEEALNRFKQDQVMFVYQRIGDRTERPLGYVWFDGDYLYNMFMVKDRQDGHTVRFVRESCHNLEQSIKTIYLHCDDWNIRAQKMFEKVGFKKF